LALGLALMLVPKLTLVLVLVPVLMLGLVLGLVLVPESGLELVPVLMLMLGLKLVPESGLEPRLVLGLVPQRNLQNQFLGVLVLAPESKLEMELRLHMMRSAVAAILIAAKPQWFELEWQSSSSPF
jgi:hypothetical protein